MYGILCSAIKSVYLVVLSYRYFDIQHPRKITAGFHRHNSAIIQSINVYICNNELANHGSSSGRFIEGDRSAGPLFS